MIKLKGVATSGIISAYNHSSFVNKRTMNKRKNGNPIFTRSNPQSHSRYSKAVNGTYYQIHSWGIGIVPGEAPWLVKAKCKDTGVLGVDRKQPI